MEYLITPHALKIESWAWWDNVFADHELDWLQKIAKHAEQTAATGSGVDREIRRSQVAWVTNAQDTAWIFEKLAPVAAEMNAKYFRFDLTGFGEALQLTNYDQSENGMYGWHVDYGGDVSRKLSLVVQLTDPSEYEGGNLQVLTTSRPETVRKKRGLVAAFPSYVLHQVTPVTQGSRQSLVAWVSGPAFK